MPTLLSPAPRTTAHPSTHRRTAPKTTSAPAEQTSAAETQLSCPACGEPAVVEWRDMVAGTSGPVVHVKLRCPSGRHWFLMPEDDI
jgi:hypothetical protein